MEDDYTLDIILLNIMRKRLNRTKHDDYNNTANESVFASRLN